MSNIGHLKEPLEQAGYLTEKLMHIQEVLEHYNCTDEEAKKALYFALEQSQGLITEYMHIYAERHNFKNWN